MSIFGLVILILVIVGITRAVRGPRELPWPEEIDEPVGEALPEELLEPLGDACVDVTRRAVELYQVLSDVERLLSQKDGMGGIEAAERFSDVEPLCMLIAEAAEEATSAHGRLPDEASWWLSFVIEKVERLGIVDEGERISGGAGGPVARGAATTALEEVSAILFACHEFSTRMLHFDLAGWVKEELGRDEAKAFARAVEDQRRKSA